MIAVNSIQLVLQAVNSDLFCDLIYKVVFNLVCTLQYNIPCVLGGDKAMGRLSNRLGNSWLLEKANNLARHLLRSVSDNQLFARLCPKPFVNHAGGNHG